jgi:hypothetical protein
LGIIRREAIENVLRYVDNNDGTNTSIDINAEPEPEAPISAFGMTFIISLSLVNS